VDIIRLKFMYTLGIKDAFGCHLLIGWEKLIIQHKAAWIPIANGGRTQLMRSCGKCLFTVAFDYAVHRLPRLDLLVLDSHKIERSQQNTGC
jgi:hypothetical protein